MRKNYILVDGHVVETDAEGASVLVFVDPDADEQRWLVQEYKLDEHTLASALDPDELSRLEFEPQHVAMIVKRPRNYSGSEQFLFHVTSMGIFLFKDRLIVVAPEYSPLAGGRPLGAMHSFIDLMLRLVNRSTVHFLEHLRVINMVTDELEQRINASMDNRYLLNLFSLQKSLVYYLNAINTNALLIAKLKNNMGKIGIGVEQSELLDDIGVENEQCYKLAEIYTNVLSSLMDARVSIVSNNLNVLMKTLNIITIGIMVPTLVVSLFSMNVPIPGQRYPISFWVILGMGFAITTGVMLFWRYKRFW